MEENSEDPFDHKFIYITNPNDIRKIRIEIKFVDIEYQPLEKKSIANLKISIVSNNSKFRYGKKGIEIEGDVSISRTFSTIIEEGGLENPLKIEGYVSEIVSKELEQVLSEVENLLKKGIPRVTIDLYEVMSRVFGSLPRI